MTDLFIPKNVLALYPMDELGYAKRYDVLKTCFKSFYLLNYAARSHENGIKNTEREITDIIAGKKIDIVLFCPFASDHQLSPEFINSLRKTAKVAYWFVDDGAYFEVYSRYYAQAADLVITTDSLAVSAYKRLGVPAILCMETVANNTLVPISAEKDIDVCFIGDMTKRGRGKYIDFLRKNGTNVVVYGEGSPNGRLPYEQISEYFCRSKINLNFTQLGELDWINREEPLLNRVRQPNGRYTAIALTRSFCLCEYAPGQEYVFDIGKEIDVFRDEAGLLEKVRYYLSNSARREKIAAAAYERAMANYRPDIYAPKLAREMTEALYGKDGTNPYTPEVYLSPAFRARTINSLTFSMFIMLKNFKLKYALETFFRLFRYGPVVFFTGFCGGAARAFRNVAGKAARYGQP